MTPAEQGFVLNEREQFGSLIWDFQQIQFRFASGFEQTIVPFLSALSLARLEASRPVAHTMIGDRGQQVAKVLAGIDVLFPVDADEKVVAGGEALIGYCG